MKKNTIFVYNNFPFFVKILLIIRYCISFKKSLLKRCLLSFSPTENIIAEMGLKVYLTQMIQ
ncbi:MAG: hypothetical protein B1H12_07085 [Desulfobacteraceae bacterium 4484_190.2]|nr:MAG: hypothetical protein B1H12_07085 [Desulfobacteraceae bacterium 4484_190.2]